MAGIGLAQVMGSTNVIALVGGGRRPKFAANKVRFSPAFEARSIVEAHTENSRWSSGTKPSKREVSR